MNKSKLGIILLTVVFLATSVQNIAFAWNVPPASAPVCGHCGREEGHETWCPSYRPPEGSTKLKNHVSMPELPDIPSTCPLCGGTNGNHISGGPRSNASGDCYIGYGLKRVQYYREQYRNAKTKEQEEMAVFNLKRWNDNINIYLDAAQKYDQEQQQNVQPAIQNVQQTNTQSMGQNAMARKKMRRGMSSSRQQPQPQQQAQEYTYKPSINLPLADNKTAGNFVVDGVNYDRRITFHLDYAAIAYGKTSPTGTQEWILTGANGNILQGSDLVSVEPMEYNDQHYFLINSRSTGYSIYDAYGNNLGLYLKESPVRIERRVLNNNIYEDRMLFVIRDNANKFCIFDPVQKNAVTPAFDNIETMALGISQNFPRFKVLQNNFYGIAEIGNSSLIVPNEYTFIKEYCTANERYPYYIVGKDRKNFGAYNYNGQLVIPLEYSLSEVEKKIASKSFK